MEDLDYGYFVGAEPDLDDFDPDVKAGCLGLILAPLFGVLSAGGVLGAFATAEDSVDGFVISSMVAIGMAALMIWAARWPERSKREQQKRRSKKKARKRVLRLAGVDSMSGQKFESFLARLYRRQGRTVEEIGGSGDMGADLVVSKDGDRTAVQAKKRADPISRRAVSDVDTAADYYDCEDAAVAATNRFTSDARELASSLGVQLVNREELADWLIRDRVALLDELSLDDLQRVTPQDFEWFVHRLLLEEGWSEAEVIGGSGDMGCDVLGEDESGKQVAVQAKRHTGSVSRSAVSDAAAAAKHFGADRSMVVTTGRFTEGARELAESVGCVLVDGDALAARLASLPG